MTATAIPTQQVSATVRWYTPCPQPNGLQATDEGVWVIDQKDHPLMAMLLDWETGKILHQFPTETNHSSGIAVEIGPHGRGSTGDKDNAKDGAIWIASTYPPIELFRYSRDGKVTRRLDTPGRTDKNGAHGLEWIEGRLWVTVPPSATTYQLDPNTGAVLKQFPAPGSRPHGVAWDGTHLWVAETTKRTITAYTLDGAPVRELALTPGPKEGPDPHGMTYYRGNLWYCDAATRAMCTIPLT